MVRVLRFHFQKQRRRKMIRRRICSCDTPAACGAVVGEPAAAVVGELAGAAAVDNPTIAMTAGGLVPSGLGTKTSTVPSFVSGSIHAPILFPLRS